MKNYSRYLILVVAAAALTTSEIAHGRFTDAGSGGNSQEVGWSWSSWSELKNKVTEKVASWFAPTKNEGGSSIQASTGGQASPGEQVSIDGQSQDSAAQAQASGQKHKDTITLTQSNIEGQTGGAAAANGSAGVLPKQLPPKVYAKVVPETSDMKKAATKVKSLNVARVLTPAVPFKDKNVVMGHNNIPVFEFKKFKANLAAVKVKKVPLLNIGSEAVLDSNGFDVISIEPLPVVTETHVEVLQSPSLANPFMFHQLLGEAVIPAKPAEKIMVPVLEPEKKVTADKIAALIYSVKQDEPVAALPVVKIDEEDLKYLRAMILFEKKDQCHVAAGIFADLLNSQKEKIAESSRYRLGLCLHEMNLPTEATYHLGKVIKGKNIEFAQTAVKTVLDEIQRQHEAEVADALIGVDPSVIPQESLGRANYIMGKHFLKKGKYEKAFEHAVQVSENEKDYFKAQYVAAVAEYLMGKVDASLARQRRAAEELTKKGNDKDTLALFEMNLGRTAFQKGKFKESTEAFQKVPKESPLWMQALQEEAWSQLQSKDSAGAVGNMHSIQSPYFDGVFKPESYVVRSIGYLNICQYGDAYRSLAYLEHKYSPWLDKMDVYAKLHNASQTYETVFKSLQGKPGQDVDTLPSQTLREIAHQRDFLNLQEGINQLIDESTGYNFIRGLVQKDEKSLMARRNATVVKVAELQAKIKKAHTTPDAMKNFNAWKFELANNLDFLSVYEFKAKTMREGLDGLNRLATKAQERIVSHKTDLKDQAGKVLKGHLLRVAKELRQSLENNELLKYEIYAGSGENLRYKVAGGKAGPDASKQIERKLAGMKWEFDGEYWEDEIGHYRSSLKNNCPVSMAGQPRGE